MVEFRVEAGRPDRHTLLRARPPSLRDGGVVAYPTDTLYGLAANPGERGRDRHNSTASRDGPSIRRFR